jgi:UDP-N-acetyl-D-glucosamine dehydrogenase
MTDSPGNVVAAELLEKIRSQRSVVGVIGLGYVGLPLVLAFVEKGFTVVGFDTDPAKVDALARGQCYIKHLDEGRVAAMAASRRFVAVTDARRLGEADAVLICVPTPLTPQRDPDMTYVMRSGRQIANTLRVGQLVVLESTTYPGTTEELVRGILEESGLRCGKDFFLAFSPEREDPGNKSYGTTNTPKVVGGVDRVSGDLAQALYDQVVTSTVRVSSARTAEACKLTENIFRAVNIALVNELKVVYDRMGMDVWEVLDAAETKPFGFMRFNPGPGWGGHCIPLDPFYLSWKAREYGVAPKFIELAGEINVSMPQYVVGKLQSALNERGRATRGSSVLILGLAYKKDIDDVRESPAFEIIQLLQDLGAVVSYHDPHLPVVSRTRRHPKQAGMISVELNEATIQSQEALVLVTDHSCFDYDLIGRAASLVVDTRGVFRHKLGIKARVIQA